MTVSRRRLLQGLGGLLAAAVGGVGLSRLGLPIGRRAGAQGVRQESQRQWGFVVDLRRCDGCKYCTQACQDTHYLAEDQEWIKVYEVEDENQNKYFIPRLCMQCENPPCVKVCPVEATFKNPDGVVLVD